MKNLVKLELYQDCNGISMKVQLSLHNGGSRKKR